MRLAAKLLGSAIERRRPLGENICNDVPREWLAEYKHSSEVFDEIVFPILTTKAECPVNGPCCGHQLKSHWHEVGDTLFGIVAHLNDDHLWTREQIADWVEQIERAEETEEQCESENSTSLTEA